jgi:hypothetical protein
MSLEKHMSDVNLTSAYMVSALETAIHPEAKSQLFKAFGKALQADVLPSDMLTEPLALKLADIAIMESRNGSEWIWSPLDLLLKKKTEFAKAILKRARELSSHSFAQKAVTLVVENNPDLINAKLIADTIKTSRLPDDAQARNDAQKTLQTIIRKRPEVVQRSFVGEIVKTIAMANHDVYHERETFILILKEHPELADFIADRLKPYIVAPGYPYTGVHHALFQLLQIHPSVISEDLMSRTAKAATEAKEPNVLNFARGNVREILEKCPEMAPIALKIIGKALSQSAANVRTAALETLRVCIRTQADALDSTLVEKVGAMTGDQDGYVRYQAFTTIGLIAEKRPDFIDQPMIDNLLQAMQSNPPGSIIQSAATFALTQALAQRPEFISSSLVNQVLALTQSGNAENTVRTLETIAEKRPDFLDDRFVMISITAGIQDINYALNNFLEIIDHHRPALLSVALDATKPFIHHRDSNIRARALGVYGMELKEAPELISEPLITDFLNIIACNKDYDTVQAVQKMLDSLFTAHKDVVNEIDPDRPIKELTTRFWDLLAQPKMA